MKRGGTPTRRNRNQIQLQLMKQINIGSAGVFYRQELFADWCEKNGFILITEADNEGSRCTVTEETLKAFQDWVIQTREKWHNLPHYFLNCPEAQKWYEIKDLICQLADEVYYFSKRRQGYERLEFEDISDT